MISHGCSSFFRPYGFLERFDPDFTPNTTDLNGRRYNFRSQPEVLVLLRHTLIVCPN